MRTGPMRKGIATLSLSGRLLDKLETIAAAGFDGVEVFDNDLIACPVPPREIAARCAGLGLGVDLFQPVRDAAGVTPAAFPDTLRRVAGKLDVAVELGAPTVLLCSHVGEDSVDDLDLVAEQLAAIGAAAAGRGLRVAFEALAWGRHVSRVGQAWEAVRRADHPAVTLAVDSFHMLSRGDDGDALSGVPGERIGFLQVADAPVLDMNVLEWSRHFRCFPGQGTLDVAGVVAATLEAGYDGPVSLEVFSDVVREADPVLTARDAHRSLVLLEDQLARRTTLDSVTAAPPAPERVDLTFVEVADPDGDVEPALTALGFTPAGAHRSKPVTWWRQGEAHVVVNRAPGLAHAIGLTVPDVESVAARAKALDWPEVGRSGSSARADGEALLPGISAPGGVHLFLSAPPGDADHWADDFTGRREDSPGATWTGLDHVGYAVPASGTNEEVGFLRGVLGLEAAGVEEFWEPQGRLRSRALRPAAGDARIVLNVEDGPGDTRPGLNQVAFSCSDLLAEAPRLRAAGVPLMRIPDNYYVDLALRFDLDPSFLTRLREHGVLYDRQGAGELLHLYTDVLAPGFYVELLERRGGYDGYGSLNTQLRLMSQRR